MTIMKVVTIVAVVAVALVSAAVVSTQSDEDAQDKVNSDNSGLVYGSVVPDENGNYVDDGLARRKPRLSLLLPLSFIVIDSDNTSDDVDFRRQMLGQCSRLTKLFHQFLDRVSLMSALQLLLRQTGGNPQRCQHGRDCR